MRNSLLRLFLIVLLFTGSASAAVPASEIDWQLIAPGIEFHQYQLPDPNNVFVVRMDRNNPIVTLESTIANGKLAEGRETVSSMYERYDQALNFWGGSTKTPSWGMRNQAVVAINGSYFDLSDGVPQGGQVQSGWYAKRFDDLGGWGGFAWKLDRSAFISQCIYHFPNKQFITFPETAGSQLIDDINDSLGANELVIYTPQYDTNTRTDNPGVEVLVEMTRPIMILPEPAFSSGIVRQIRHGAGNSYIPFNSIVISASGTAAKYLLDNIQVGSEIRISQENASFEGDCATPEALSWTKTYASIQGAFFFLKNGVIKEFNDDPGAVNRNPRTAIAMNDQYIFFIVVDGRDAQNSVGMSINELAYFVRDVLGADSGVSEDGGGSSTMVIDGKVINNTYCNIYSCAGTAGEDGSSMVKISRKMTGNSNAMSYTQNPVYLPLALVTTMVSEEELPAPPPIIGDVQIIPPLISEVVSSDSGIEREVGNGMLMVITLPGIYSRIFQPGDRVVINEGTEVRLGPGTNYAAFNFAPKGRHGIVTDQINHLNGVLAKFAFWWYVDFGSFAGWVPQEILTNQSAEMD